MELLQLRCFLAVAEELHFGRAARKLSMTQPPLSRNIRLLEERLGARLFIRDSRTVTLSQAGAVILPEVRKILRSVNRLSDLAVLSEKGQIGDLGLGFTASNAYELVPLILAHISHELPRLNLILKELVSGSQMRMIVEEQLDIGLVRPPIDHTVFHSQRIITDRMLIAAPTGMKGTENQQALSLKAFDGQDFIMLSRDEAAYFRNMVDMAFTSVGASPRIVHTVSQPHTALSLVSSNAGATLVPYPLRKASLPGIRYFDILESEVMEAETYIIWRKTENRAAVLNAVQCIIQHMCTSP